MNHEYKDQYDVPFNYIDLRRMIHVINQRLKTIEHSLEVSQLLKRVQQLEMHAKTQRIEAFDKHNEQMVSTNMRFPSKRRNDERHGGSVRKTTHPLIWTAYADRSINVES